MLQRQDIKQAPPRNGISSPQGKPQSSSGEVNPSVEAWDPAALLLPARGGLQSRTGKVARILVKARSRAGPFADRALGARQHLRIDELHQAPGAGKGQQHLPSSAAWICSV